MFALPGVKVQIPNGRNEDGTYRIIPYTTQNVITREVTGTGVKDITLQPNGILNWATGGVYFAEDGYHRGYIVSSINISAVLARVLITTAGKIDSFVPRNVDSVVNSNASNFSQAGRSYLSGLGMPSSNYETWTLGASVATYIAPANGWVTAGGVSSANSRALTILSSGYLSNGDHSYSSGTTLRVTIPCLKGSSITFTYEGVTSPYIRFVYAEGEN